MTEQPAENDRIPEEYRAKELSVAARDVGPRGFLERPERKTGARSGRAAANGVDLYYEIHGAGPPLVLVAGLGAATWLWEEQLPAFAAHFSTVVYDNRGSGRSSKPPGPYTVAQLAGDLAGLLDGLEIPRAHVLGASLGGYIAQEFALRWPERVDRLVLAATSAGGGAHVPMSAETVARFFETGGPIRDLLRRKLALAFTETFLAGEKVEHLIDLRLADPQPPHAFQAQAAAGLAFARGEDVRAIRAPTLILAASEDLIVPLPNAHTLASLIPGSRLVIHEGLGHQFFVEAPEAFNRDVLDFLLEVR